MNKLIGCTLILLGTTSLLFGDCRVHKDSCKNYAQRYYATPQEKIAHYGTDRCCTTCKCPSWKHTAGPKKTAPKASTAGAAVSTKSTIPATAVPSTVKK